MTENINLGSGEGWSLKGWDGLDKIGGQFLNAKSTLPYKTNSIKHVYSSHFFEHINDETTKTLFAECYRVLRSEGVIRIAVPDFGLFIQKYRDGDEHWYRKVLGFEPRPEWPKYGVNDCLSNMLLHWIANHDFDGPKGFYRGPPIGIPEKDVKHKAAIYNTQEFCEWAQGLIPTDKRVLGNHINWWDVTKFKQMLTQAGFKDVRRSEYTKSIAPMMSGGMFDSWKPNRKCFSLYIEAIK